MTIPTGQATAFDAAQALQLARQTLTSGFNYKIGTYKIAVGK